jgi:acetate kinase
MGFTPLEGLVMGTRSGDIDPAVLPYLVRAAGFSVDQAEDLLNRRSGILGLSGLSSDMREVMKAASDGAPRSSLAIEVFCYRVRKYIGAYIAALGGLDAVAFGGGIGENQAEVRQRVLEPLAWCGLELDRSRNQDPATSGGRITTDASRVQAFVIPVDESLLIARDTYACLRADRGATASGGGNAL